MGMHNSFNLHYIEILKMSDWDWKLLSTSHRNYDDLCLALLYQTSWQTDNGRDREKEFPQTRETQDAKKMIRLER